MSIQQLYQSEIRKHSRNPVGAGITINATHHAEGYNPSCGDELNLYLELQSDETCTDIRSIAFNADACAICTASASLLCEHSQGKSLAHLLSDIDAFAQSLTQKTPITIPSLECLGAVSQHPSRVNCALLPWQTLKRVIGEPARNRFATQQS